MFCLVGHFVTQDVRRDPGWNAMILGSPLFKNEYSFLSSLCFHFGKQSDQMFSLILLTVLEVGGSSWLWQTRPWAETDLPLRQDPVQRRTAHCWVCHSHTGKCVEKWYPKHFLDLYIDLDGKHSSWTIHQDLGKDNSNTKRIWLDLHKGIKPSIGQKAIYTTLQIGVSGNKHIHIICTCLLYDLYPHCAALL